MQKVVDVPASPGVPAMTEIQMDTCIFPPTQVIDVQSFPASYRFCTVSQLPAHLKSRYYFSGVQHDPETFMGTVYDARWPGWRWAYKDAIAAWNTPAMQAQWDTTKNYLFCGFSQDLTSRWNRYTDAPTGTPVPYTHGWFVKSTTEQDVCPSWTNAVGAALGYITYIELLGTLVVVGTMVLLGIAKPRSKEASIMNMLKGAGMSELDEKLEKMKVANDRKLESKSAA